MGTGLTLNMGTQIEVLMLTKIIFCKQNAYIRTYCNKSCCQFCIGKVIVFMFMRVHKSIFLWNDT